MEELLSSIVYVNVPGCTWDIKHCNVGTVGATDYLRGTTCDPASPSCAGGITDGGYDSWGGNGGPSNILVCYYNYVNLSSLIFCLQFWHRVWSWLLL